MNKNALITVIVPVVIELFKLLAPRVPKKWLPLVAPVLGAAADALGYYGGILNESNPGMAAVYGMAGAGLYDIYKKLRPQTNDR